MFATISISVLAEIALAWMVDGMPLFNEVGVYWCLKYCPG